MEGEDILSVGDCEGRRSGRLAGELALEGSRDVLAEVTMAIELLRGRGNENEEYKRRAKREAHRTWTVRLVACGEEKR